MRIPTLLKLGSAAVPVAVGAGVVSDKFDPSSLGVVRFGRAALTVLKIGIDYKMLFKKYPDSSQPGYAEAIHDLHLKSAISLRTLCCKNGGAFIKVGQHLGSLEYLLPGEYVETMKVLHDRAPQSPLEDLKAVVLEDLGVSVEDLFEEFEPTPLGAASLAQVHKAKLKGGDWVAVKIQHPKVKANSRVDISTMEFLVKTVNWAFPSFDYVWLGEETRKNLPVELDFLNEGRNCEKLAAMLSKFSFLKVPKIMWQYCSDRVLMMEYCEGGKVDDQEYMRKHGIKVDQITQRLGQLYSEMIFIQGYVHCDPHPGNVLVRQGKFGPEIVLLDHGLYQTLTDEFRVNYSKMWMAMINADVEGIKKYAEALNVGDLYGLFACMLSARSWEALQAGIDKNQFTPEEGDAIKTNVGNYLTEISTILTRVPRQMLLLLKTNDVLRGIESALNSRPSSASFINMSKCCIKAVTESQLLSCQWRDYLRIKVYQQLQLARISIYSIYLWLITIPMFSKKRKALHS